MAFFDLFRRKRKPTDPLAAYDARLDALAQRAQLLRKSAATLLAVRRDLDRRLDAFAAKERDAQARAEAARQAGDPQAAEVLANDALARERDRDALAIQRERVATDAQDLTDAVGALNAEFEQLSRERDAAQVALAAGQVVSAAQPALTERFDQVLKLDAARDEVERAHALAEIHRDDAARRRRERA